MATIERNEIFDLAFRFVTETSENIFLTGKAGTGKTTFLKYLKENCTKNMLVAAPTGVAAINAGGVTLHSLFQLPFHPFLPTKNSKDELLAKIRYNGQRQQLLRKIDVLVIDEISMVRCDTLDAIDTILKSVRRNYNLPFGGVQLLCIGDLYQLPPVAQNSEWNILSEYYESPFFFDSLAIKDQMPLLIELTKIYRQKEDSFVKLLNNVRTNNMTADDFEDLHQRYIPNFEPSADENFITLTSHNNQADTINQKKLNQLIAPAIIFKAEVDGDFPENMYPADAALELKQGAQVMFIKNDTAAQKYFNGKIGVVKSLEKEKIIVDCDGEEITVQKESWDNSKYQLNRDDGKLVQEVVGTFTQYPLRLAWAITIHKSQGLTFTHLMIDAASAFSSGQVYVALSRCTSLDGIVLLSKIPTSAIISNNHVTKSQHALTHKGSLADRFAGARKIFTQELLETIFSFTDIENGLTSLSYHINQLRATLNEDAVQWIESFKTTFGAEKQVGIKFIGRINDLLKDEGIIENNALLQKRISDAANHFYPKWAGFLNAIQNPEVVTELKESANIINEHLQNVALQIFSSKYYLDYCKQPFSVTTFLEHKLKFAQPRFSVSCYATANKKVVANTNANHPELMDTLKRWRNMVVEQTGQPIYMIANQNSLNEVCTYLPLTKTDLQLLTGFGKVKVDTYGDDILDAVIEYCLRNNLKTNINEKTDNPKKQRKEKSTEPKADTKKLSFDLYKEGKTINEIAKERTFTKATIEGHLAHYIALGELAINDLVSIEKQNKINEVIAIHGELSHKTLIENLPSDYSYGEIKMVLAANRFNSK